MYKNKKILKFTSSSVAKDIKGLPSYFLQVSTQMNKQTWNTSLVANVTPSSSSFSGNLFWEESKVDLPITVTRNSIITTDIIKTLSLKCCSSPLLCLLVNHCHLRQILNMITSKCTTFFTYLKVTHRTVLNQE